MITVRNGTTGDVCCIDELVLNWGGEHISHLYYDQDTEVEMVAFRMLDTINNSTGSQWGREDVCWNLNYRKYCYQALSRDHHQGRCDHWLEEKC